MFNERMGVCQRSLDLPGRVEFASALRVSRTSSASKRTCCVGPCNDGVGWAIALCVCVCVYLHAGGQRLACRDGQLLHQRQPDRPRRPRRPRDDVEGPVEQRRLLGVHRDDELLHAVHTLLRERAVAFRGAAERDRDVYVPRAALHQGHRHHLRGMGEGSHRGRAVWVRDPRDRIGGELG